MQIGKILAQANLAAACENKMTSELGFDFLYTHGNLYMLAHTLATTFSPVLPHMNSSMHQIGNMQVTTCADAHEHADAHANVHNAQNRQYVAY